jgi:putative hydrolase of the HAD superfamily
MRSSIDTPDFDVLLFDLGGVLIDFAGFEELNRMLPDTPGKSEIRSRWINSEAVKRFERGQIDPDEFAQRTIVEYRLYLSVEDFIERFVDWARGPYPGAVELLRQVRQTHRVASLSNSNALHTPIHRRSLQHVVETFYFSDEIGHVKPEREIFDHVIRDLAVRPERIAFFDDTTVNVEAARNVGLTAYWVDGIDALNTQLHSLRLLTSSIE